MVERRSGLGKGLEALIPQAERKNLAIIATDQIEPNPNQPRSAFDSDTLASLAESIRKVGVLQPVVVRPDGDRYVLIAGERRWRATQEAGLTEIPALIRETDEAGSLTEALIENLQREDLGPLEEAAAFQQLQDDFGMTQADIGASVGRSRTAVSNAVRLLQLSPALQTAVRSGDLSAGHGRALLALEDTEAAEALAETAIEEGWSVRQMEEAVRSASEPPDPDPRSHPILIEIRPAAIIELEQRLSEQLGTKVKIRFKNNKGRVEMSFSSLDALERIYRRFFTE
jgi:ParB family chromosome partitioning protein